MATPSGILTWEIQWIKEPGGQQSVGSQRFGHDSATKPPPSPYLVTVEKKLIS